VKFRFEVEMNGGEVDAQIFEFLKLINFNQGHFRSLVIN